MLQEYPGNVPLHSWLKEHFRKHRQFGSKDRRFYRSACYAFFRLGPGLHQYTIAQRICLGLWKYHPELNGPDEWLAEKGLTPEEVFKNIPNAYSSFEPQLSQPCHSAALQPWFETIAPVYLVAPTGKKSALQSELTRLGIAISQTTELGFAVPAGSNLDALLETGLCRVMDLGSQQSMVQLPVSASNTVWDCCAGAGGKSLMLAQLYPNIHLYATDLRPEALQQLQSRFSTSGLKTPMTAVADLNRPLARLPFGDQPELAAGGFDVILADVPCSGSGTWRRNPEELHQFRPEQIQTYAGIQKSVVSHALPFLKPGGYLIYVTCSVFAAENEQQADGFLQTLPLSLLQSGFTSSTDANCDMLFRAVFQKNQAPL